MKKCTIKRQPIKKQKTKTEPFKDKIRAISKKTSKLDELIYSIPDFDKREIMLVKINGKYYDVSRIRNLNRVELDTTKLKHILTHVLRYERNLSSIKQIHTHIGDDPLPSIADIVSCIKCYKLLPKNTLFPISIIDPNTKKVCGRTFMYLTKTTERKIQENFREPALSTNTISNSADISVFKNEIGLEYRKYLLKSRLLTPDINLETGQKILVPSKDAIPERIFQYNYFKQLYGYKIRIQPYPGYRLNRKTMTIEKI